MGPIERSITNKLDDFFKTKFLQVTNESYMHSVPEGSESHFKLVIVSDQFNTRRLVQRHQSVYKLLSEELSGPVHALALHTYTASEWAEKNVQAPDSPQCLGGSKAN